MAHIYRFNYIYIYIHIIDGDSFYSHVALLEAQSCFKHPNVCHRLCAQCLHGEEAPHLGGQLSEASGHQDEDQLLGGIAFLGDGCHDGFRWVSDFSQQEFGVRQRQKDVL